MTLCSRGSSFRLAPPPAGNLFHQCVAVVFILAFLFSVWVEAGSGSGGQRILVLGDSLAAGYGVGPEEAFPSILADRIRKEGLHAEVINAGVSGETTAGGLRRLPWLLANSIDILILELGANDGLRGIPLEETEKNLRQIIQMTRQRFPDIKIVLAGMRIPPNMGPSYTRRFEEIYQDLSREKSTLLIPFLLEGVAGRSELNLPDGVHPTAQGHRIVAKTLWDVVQPLLESE